MANAAVSFAPSPTITTHSDADCIAVIRRALSVGRHAPQTMFWLGFRVLELTFVDTPLVVFDVNRALSLLPSLALVVGSVASNGGLCSS